MPVLRVELLCYLAARFFVAAFFFVAVPLDAAAPVPPPRPVVVALFAVLRCA